VAAPFSFLPVTLRVSERALLIPLRTFSAWLGVEIEAGSVHFAHPEPDVKG
jgi:hypothetical protein